VDVFSEHSVLYFLQSSSKFLILSPIRYQLHYGSILYTRS